MPCSNLVLPVFPVLRPDSAMKLRRDTLQEHRRSHTAHAMALAASCNVHLVAQQPPALLRQAARGYEGNEVQQPTSPAPRPVVPSEATTKCTSYASLAPENSPRKWPKRRLLRQQNRRLAKVRDNEGRPVLSHDAEVPGVSVRRFLPDQNSTPYNARPSSIHLSSRETASGHLIN